MATVPKYINCKYQHKIKPLNTQHKMMYENICGKFQNVPDLRRPSFKIFKMYTDPPSVVEASPLCM